MYHFHIFGCKFAKKEISGINGKIIDETKKVC